MVEQLALGVRAQVLDVGCGPGWMSEYLARCGYWVTGIDISEDMVEIARERVAAIPEPVGEGIDAYAEFHAMPVRELPWENRFDAAILYDTMHHFDDEVETLRVILRALAPGGRIYIREGVRPEPGTPDERNLVVEMEQFGTLESPFDPAYLRWCVQEAGFVDARQFMEVDRLVAFDDTSGALGLLTGWIRARRGRPQTNTLIAAKPVADLGGGGAWRGQVSAAGPPTAAPGGATRVPLRIQNTGRAFWPAHVRLPVHAGHRQHGAVSARGRRARRAAAGRLPHSLPGGGDDRRGHARARGSTAAADEILSRPRSRGNGGSRRLSSRSRRVALR